MRVERYRPGEIGLLLQLLLHFAANLAGDVVDLAHFGEEGGDLVAPQEAGRPSLQRVTQAGLDGSWGDGNEGGALMVVTVMRRWFNMGGGGIVIKTRCSSIRTGDSDD